MQFAKQDDERVPRRVHAVCMVWSINHERRLYGSVQWRGGWLVVAGKLELFIHLVRWWSGAFDPVSMTGAARGLAWRDQEVTLLYQVKPETCVQYDDRVCVCVCRSISSWRRWVAVYAPSKELYHTFILWQRVREREWAGVGKRKDTTKERRKCTEKRRNGYHKTRYRWVTAGTKDRQIGKIASTSQNLEEKFLPSCTGQYLGAVREEEDRYGRVGVWWSLIECSFPFVLCTLESCCCVGSIIYHGALFRIWGAKDICSIAADAAACRCCTVWM